MKRYREIVLQDWHRYSESEPTWKHLTKALLFDAGFLAVFLLRLSQALEDRNKKRFARIVRRFNLFISSAELSPGALVQSGLYLPHPYGVGIGGGCRIGKDATIHQGVSLGAKTISLGADQRSVAYPQVGDFVIIYPHVLAFGEVRIGDHSVILGNSVVTADVPERSVYGGIPARPIQLPSGFVAENLGRPASVRRLRDEGSVVPASNDNSD